MKFIDILRRSGRSLRSAKGRTILTALAISVGAFTLTLTLAAGNGAREYTDKLIASTFDPSELLVGRDPEVTNTGTPSEKPKEFDDSVSSIAIGPTSSLQVKRVTKADIDQIKALPYIEQVRESYQINVRYVTRDGEKKYTSSAEAYNPAQKPEVGTGNLPSKGDIDHGAILLPESYVEVLGFKTAQDAIGQEVKVTVQQPFSSTSLQTLLNQSSIDITSVSPESLKPQEKTYTFKIKAITKTPATSLSFGVIPLRISSNDARDMYEFTSKGTPDYQKYLIVNARVVGGADTKKLEQAKSNLQSKGYYVQSSKDLQKAITQFVNILQIMVGVFGLITVIASVFGIVNTQYISVLERTREIGLMKALGMSRRHVSRLFMVEATWIGFFGGIVGATLAFLLGKVLNPWITKKLDLGPGNSLIIFKPLQIALMIAALMLVATIAGLLPARKAAKLDPIEALRTG